MRIGTDIVEIERVERAIMKSAGFTNRVFRTSEIDYCRSRNRQSGASFAGIYAAKEAFLKALGTGMRKGSWQDICVEHDAAGAPFFKIEGIFAELMAQQSYTQVEVSISHCRTYAVAQVLLS